MSRSTNRLPDANFEARADAGAADESAGRPRLPPRLAIVSRAGPTTKPGGEPVDEPAAPLWPEGLNEISVFTVLPRPAELIAARAPTAAPRRRAAKTDRGPRDRRPERRATP